MNKENLIQILREEKYPEFMIENTVEKIRKFSPILNTAFSEWMIKRSHPTIEIEGYSYDLLIQEFGMKPIGAFITLDWLIRDPIKAITSLKKGIK